MIAILDYQMGNLKSVSKALETVGAKCEVTRDPAVVAKADRLVVPGVGAFRDCMAGLSSQGLTEPIQDFIRSGRPYLGICLGMQILMEESEEGGHHPGLGIFPGKVLRFSPKLPLKVPHMGWNQLNKKMDSRLLKDIPNDSYVYFVHSYYVAPENKKITSASTDYGIPFTSCIEFENIFAVQFHPEKSQQIGLKILKAFVELK
jgi:glutamine amidotransferase